MGEGVGSWKSRGQQGGCVIVWEILICMYKGAPDLQVVSGREERSCGGEMEKGVVQAFLHKIDCIK